MLLATFRSILESAGWKLFWLMCLIAVFNFALDHLKAWDKRPALKPWWDVLIIIVAVVSGLGALWANNLRINLVASKWDIVEFASYPYYNSVGIGWGEKPVPGRSADESKTVLKRAKEAHDALTVELIARGLGRRVIMPPDRPVESILGFAPSVTRYPEGVILVMIGGPHNLIKEKKERQDWEARWKEFERTNVANKK